ncbi:hypothetical protein SAMN06265218_101394 [Fodinibius sediminis]|uniref:ISXO2-like transposase domain-containing protein n=1 Tax=Fodinibius sediminis TaxID=1214077 RepID=A0A521AV34_9BACT|nr:hypothetical protein SAMN06265218_101394 [Fodinibius sediminis]
MDFTTTDAAELTGISRRSVTDIYGRIRQKIARWSEQEAPLAGTIEVDKSYFGTKRIPGKRGWGGGGKTIVFRVFKCQGKIYTGIVPDA